MTLTDDLFSYMFGDQIISKNDINDVNKALSREDTSIGSQITAQNTPAKFTSSQS